MNYQKKINLIIYKIYYFVCKDIIVKFFKALIHLAFIYPFKISAYYGGK